MVPGLMSLEFNLQVAGTSLPFDSAQGVAGENCPFGVCWYDSAFRMETREVSPVHA